MAALPHWNLRTHLKHFRSTPNFPNVAVRAAKGSKFLGAEARYYVLQYLILSANGRLRCWPGRDLIADDTDFSRTCVTEALKWLEHTGAIYNVPKKHRVGNEAEVHATRRVWQLTGVIALGGRVVQYLKLNEDQYTPFILEAIEHGNLADETAAALTRAADLGPLNGPKTDPLNEPESVLGPLNGPILGPLNGLGREVLGPLSGPEGIKEIPEGKESQDTRDSAPAAPAGPAAPANASPTESTAAASSRKKTKTEDPERAKAIAAMIGAWIEGLGAKPPGNPYNNKTNRKLAAELLDGGVTAGDVRDYTRVLMADTFWRHQGVKFTTMAERIKFWINGGRKADPRDVAPISRVDPTQSGEVQQWTPENDAAYKRGIALVDARLQKDREQREAAAAAAKAAEAEKQRQQRESEKEMRELRPMIQQVMTEKWGAKWVTNADAQADFKTLMAGGKIGAERSPEVNGHA